MHLRSCSDEGSFSSLPSSGLNGISRRGLGVGAEAEHDMGADRPSRLSDLQSNGEGMDGVREVLSSAIATPASEANGASCSESAEGVFAVVGIDGEIGEGSGSTRREVKADNLLELDEDTVGTGLGCPNNDLRRLAFSRVSGRDTSASHRPCSPCGHASFVSESVSIGTLEGTSPFDSIALLWGHPYMPVQMIG